MRAAIACVLGVVVGGCSGLMLTVYVGLTYDQLTGGPHEPYVAWCVTAMAAPAGGLLGAAAGGLLFWRWWRKAMRGG